MIHVGIVGASGYSGAELMRLLAPRTDISLDVVSAATSAGKRVDEMYPSLTGVVDLTLGDFTPSLFDGLDLVFVALPSGGGMTVVPELLDRAGRVIDLGGDFRLQDALLYESFYGHRHTATGLLPEAVYGLPELNADRIVTACLIANPGCYPTSAILPLAPLLKIGAISPEGIVITSLSGVSGAGRSASVDMSFAEVNENVRAYKIGTHQHIPEIQSVLATVAGKDVSLSFVPHLVPLTRGIYTTIHASLVGTFDRDELLRVCSGFYADAPFVRVRQTVPQIKDVVMTNFCDFTLTVEERTKQVIITSTIDNLVKGAAGQALQNMNLMFSLPETAGLLGKELHHV
jgi:N-acetyl-gamma-glutamyl-phosphate reductase